MVGIKLFKKISASSLVEALVSTVIIMIVFGITIFSISNLLERKIKSSSFSVEQEVNKQVYFFKNNKLKLPLTTEKGNWLLEFERELNIQDTLLTVTVKNQISSMNSTYKVYK